MTPAWFLPFVWWSYKSKFTVNISLRQKWKQGESAISTDCTWRWSSKDCKWCIGLSLWICPSWNVEPFDIVAQHCHLLMCWATFVAILRTCIPWATSWTHLSLSFFQEQEDPNKMATSWPDYYIDRINSMAAVSVHSSPALLLPRQVLEDSGSANTKPSLLLSNATFTKT